MKIAINGLSARFGGGAAYIRNLLKHLSIIDQENEYIVLTSPERESELMSFMFSAKEIVQVHKTVGDWDLEVDIESSDNKKVRYLTTQLRAQFKDIIQTFNIAEFIQYYERRYLPFFLFQNEEKP